MTANVSPCRYLEWDSAFFARRIARVIPTRLTAKTMRDVLAWCAAETIDCLYFLADADNAGTVRLAEDHGFRLVDVRVTLGRELQSLPATSSTATHAPLIRLCQEEDLPSLRAIARNSYRDSRFYFDGHFSEQQCNAFYETWIENSCRGYAQAVLVAQIADRPGGYVTCNLDADSGSIALIGVDPHARGRGTGTHLVTAALDWFKQQGAERVTVVTQGRNIAAQRLYQRSGFITQSVQLWYHRWFGEDRSS